MHEKVDFVAYIRSLADEIDAGNIMVNEMAVDHDPPYGHTKMTISFTRQWQNRKKPRPSSVPVEAAYVV